MCGTATGDYAGRNALAGCGGRNFGHGYRRGADNAADHAAHLPTGDAARYSANDASRAHLRRGFVFFQIFQDFLRNLGGLAQLAIHNIGLNLSHHMHCRCRRWWRWRWRRGCHQVANQLRLGQGVGKNQRKQDHHNDNPDLKQERDEAGCSPLGFQLAAGLDEAVFKHRGFSLQLERTEG